MALTFSPQSFSSCSNTKKYSCKTVCAHLQVSGAPRTPTQRHSKSLTCSRDESFERTVGVTAIIGVILLFQALPEAFVMHNKFFHISKCVVIQGWSKRSLTSNQVKQNTIFFLCVFVRLVHWTDLIRSIYNWNLIKFIGGLCMFYFFFFTKHVFVQQLSSL